MTPRAVLTDEMWALVEPLMPSSDGKRGKPFRDHRQVVEGIIYRYRAGICWRDLPADFGPWQTVWKRHRRFAADGTWDQVLTTLLATADAAGIIDWEVCVDSTINRAHQHGTNLARDTGELSNHTNLRIEPPDHALGRSRGGLSTKVHQLVDGKGRPLVVLIGPGQANDSPMFPNLLAALRVPRIGPGRARTRPTVLIADRAYSARSHRALLRSRGIAAVIPEKVDQQGGRKRRGSHGGRPPVFDATKYKKRHVIECSFSLTKQWRALATRYDKLALTYRAGVVLRAVTIWLSALGDTA